MQHLYPAFSATILNSGMQFAFRKLKSKNTLQRSVDKKGTDAKALAFPSTSRKNRENIVARAVGSAAGSSLFFWLARFTHQPLQALQALQAL